MNSSNFTPLFKHQVQVSLFALGLLSACSKITSTQPLTIDYASIPEVVRVAPGLIDEASGLADSRTIEDYLWVIENRGTSARLKLITHDGKLVGSLPLPGVQNQDWEDMAAGSGPQPGVSYLYLLDIGNNMNRNEENHIYRLAEPKSLTAPAPAVERISFRYADGPRDAATILLDPSTRDLWIVTKNETNVRLYQLPFPQSTYGVMTATFKGELPLSLVTSGSISPDGMEILLKTPAGVYYWPRFANESVEQAMRDHPPRPLTYLNDYQGESICFDRKSNGFFILSKRGNAASVTLNYYKHL